MKFLTQIEKCVYKKRKRQAVDHKKQELGLHFFYKVMESMEKETKNKVINRQKCNNNFFISRVFRQNIYNKRK